MTELVSIGNGHSLSPEAAASWKRTVREGNPGRVINSSTRDYATQKRWFENKGKPGYPKYVADPDESKHVWRPDDKKDKGARALDLNDPCREWMVKHGREYGWFRPWPDVEPWHFEYDIKLDKHLEDDMPTAKEIVDELLSRRIPHTAGQQAASNRPDAEVARILGDASAGGFRSWKDLPQIRTELKQTRARLTALEKAISRGANVSARDVARELEPLVADDIRDAVQAAVAGLPTKDADSVAKAVAAQFASLLAGTDD